MINRRKLITGLISFAAAPAIVKASSLMPVKSYDTFDPSLLIYNIGDYIHGVVSIEVNTPRLYWIDNLKNIHVMPIEKSNFYLDSLNDHA